MSAVGITRSPVVKSLKGMDIEPPMRSWKVPRKEKIKNPDPSHEKGDDVWMKKDGQKGSFKVKINSDAKWNKEKEEYEYEVKQTNGKLYKDLVGEKNLRFEED